MKTQLRRIWTGVIFLSFIAAICAVFAAVVYIGAKMFEQGGLWHLGWIPIALAFCWFLGASEENGW